MAICLKMKKGSFLNRYYTTYKTTTAAGFKDLKDFIGKVSAAYEKSKAEDLARESAIKENEQATVEKEQIAVDLSKVDAPKVNAPKVDAPKVEVNDPSKERIVVSEVFGNADGEQVSDKVKEPNVPVSSKSKE